MKINMYTLLKSDIYNENFPFYRHYLKPHCRMVQNRLEGWRDPVSWPHPYSGMLSSPKHFP